MLEFLGTVFLSLLLLFGISVLLLAFLLIGFWIWVVIKTYEEIS